MYNLPRRHGFPQVPCREHHVYSTIVIPHIHPVNTVTVNHQLVVHKHFFPQTYTPVHTVSHFNDPVPGAGYMLQRPWR